MLTGVFIVVVALALECCCGNHLCSSENSLRLYNPYSNASTDEGMVQVCRSNIWTAVCGHYWGCNEGKAACKQLGYGGSYLRAALISRSTQYFGSWSYFDTDYYYLCSSSSTSLANCTRIRLQYYSRYNCFPAGLWCMNFSVSSDHVHCANGAVRLVGGQSSREGRLEYCNHGEWSPFCSLSIPTATVACKQLGFNSPKVAIFTDGRFGIVSNYSLFYFFNCWYYSTILSSLTSCSLSGNCASRCSTNIGIGCYESGHDGCTDGAVRLVNGTTEYEGRVEVCYDGIWGTVCNVDIPDAIVVCKTLGYAGSSAHYTSSQFGDGGRPQVYWFYCRGYEENIQLCQNSSYSILFGWHCSRRLVSGVRCHHGCKDGDVRLTGGSSAAEGTVEACLNKTWGLVSGLGWGEEEARVVCRQLRFQAEGSLSYSDTPFGNEKRLTNCATNKLTFEEGKQFISVAGVSCNIECPSPVPLLCPTTQCPNTQRSTTQHPMTVVQTVTDYKSNANPQGSQQAQPAGLSESGHTLTIFLLIGLSGILGTVTVALGVCLCYMTYKNGKLKERFRTTGRTANSGSHDISAAPITVNACYQQNPFTTAFEDGTEKIYETVDIK